MCVCVCVCVWVDVCVCLCVVKWIGLQQAAGGGGEVVATCAMHSCAQAVHAVVFQPREQFNLPLQSLVICIVVGATICCLPLSGVLFFSRLSPQPIYLLSLSLALCLSLSLILLTHLPIVSLSIAPSLTLPRSLPVLIPLSWDVFPLSSQPTTTEYNWAISDWGVCRLQVSGTMLGSHYGYNRCVSGDW